MLKFDKTKIPSWLYATFWTVIIIFIVVACVSILYAIDVQPTAISSEVVEAIVIETAESSSSNKNGYVIVEYNGMTLKITNQLAFEKYNNNIGSIIPVVMITRTYNNETSNSELAFNQIVFEGGKLR